MSMTNVIKLFTFQQKEHPVKNDNKENREVYFTESNGWEGKSSKIIFRWIP